MILLKLELYTVKNYCHELLEKKMFFPFLSVWYLKTLTYSAYPKNAIATLFFYETKKKKKKKKCFLKKKINKTIGFFNSEKI